MAQKDQITVKKVGRNVIVIVDKKKYSKQIADADERQSFVEQVEAYNKRNSKAKKEAILDIVDKTRAVKKEKKGKIVKAKKEVKKATKGKDKGKGKAKVKKVARKVKDTLSAKAKDIADRIKSGNLDSKEKTALRKLLGESKDAAAATVPKATTSSRRTSGEH